MLKSVLSVLLAAGFGASIITLAHADTVAIETHQADELAPPVSIQDGTSLAGLYLAATLAETERDIPSAADFYRAAYELDPTSDRFLHSAFTMGLADGRMDDALTLAGILSEAGDTGMARLTLAFDAVRQRSYRAALRDLEAYRTDGFGDLVGVLVSAWVLHGSGDTEEALARLDTMEGPAWVELYSAYHSGLIRLAAGDNEAALADLERAYTTDAGSLRLVQGYARALVANDRTDDAVQAIESFLELSPFNAVMLDDLAALQAGQSLTRAVTTPQQGIAEVAYGLGLALGQDGAEEVGAIYLNLGLHAHPELDLARFGLARVYESLELWERAVEIYEPIAANHPLKRTAEIRLGVLLDQLERPDEADLHLEALIESDPTDLEAVNTYGSVLRFRRDFEKAAEVYTAGIETLDDVRREHWRLFYQRGIAYERTDRWTQAEADFLTALDLSPEQPDVMNYLAYTWVDRGEHLDRSVDMLERAVILDPSQGVIHDHLGDAYWMVGRRLEARFQWSHARDLEDSDEVDIEAIQRKLQRGLTREEVESVGTWPEGYEIPTLR